MMAEGYYQVAKDYIIYRAQRSAKRELEEARKETGQAVQEPKEEATRPQGKTFVATGVDGSKVSISEGDLRNRIEHACRGL